jgi:Calx-beta domain
MRLDPTRALVPALFAFLVSAAVGAGAQPPSIPAAPLAVEGQSEKTDLSPPLGAIRPIPPVPGPVRRLVRRALASAHRDGPRLKAQLGAGSGLPTSTTAKAPAAPSVSFEGINNVDFALPPDPNGDVGPSHYVQWVNLSFAVFSKTGALLYGPAAGNTLWSGFGGPCESDNQGDPIVLYDKQAGRWVFSQLASDDIELGPFVQCVAVSTTGDPLGPYYRYAFATNPAHPTWLGDYPKLAVWPDAYYLAINQFQCEDPLCESSTFQGQGALAFQRAKMLAGLPAGVVVRGVDPSNPGRMLPSHWSGGPPPPLGTPNYFVQANDSARGFAGVASDELQIWAFHVDWTNPAASTFTRAATLSPAPFDSHVCQLPDPAQPDVDTTNCIPQPGHDFLGLPSPGVDAIPDRLMYRLHYRNFGDHQALVANHTVNVTPGLYDANGVGHAGIRWYELRDSGGGWELYQQGTFAPDGRHRWMGSLALDRDGNIALGYSLGDATTYPSIAYTGRTPADPLGTMGTEVVAKAGAGAQEDSSGRWGDYSSMGVDPTDDCTFWYTQEYYAATNVILGVNWRTRIVAFRFPSCTGAPVVPALRIASTGVVEGNSGTTNAVFSVTLSAPSAKFVTVDYRTANGTATAGSDYLRTTGTLTFPPGATSRTITVPVIGDTLPEANEYFLVILSNPVNATIARAVGAGVILTDDQ